MAPQLDSGASMAEASINRIFPRSLKHTSLVLKIRTRLHFCKREQTQGSHLGNQSCPGLYAEPPQGLWATLGGAPYLVAKENGERKEGH